MKWCRRCRKFQALDAFGSYKSTKDGKSAYCKICQKLITSNPDAFNRYSDSNTFINTSFQDAITSDYWPGFQPIKWSITLRTQLENQFRHDDLRFIASFNTEDKKHNIEANGKWLYLCISNSDEILKVGQSVNWKNRFSHYYRLRQYLPISFELFSTTTWEKQDLLEHKIRNYLEFLGYVLPEDFTDQRLKYINVKAKISAQ